MRACVLQSPFKLACEQEANTRSGARSYPQPALTPAEGHDLRQERWGGWGSCLLPADSTPSMFTPTAEPASFLWTSPGGLQEQSIYH